MNAPAVPSARLRRVNGPLLEITDLPAPRMSDVVEVGDDAVTAEIVAINADSVTAQAFEYTGGLRVGDGVRSTAAALSARLGPDLLGRCFDGLLRPLSAAGVWLDPRQRTEVARRWKFRPVPDLADSTGSDGRMLTAGTVLGVVDGTGTLEHRLLVPPGVDGPLEWLAPPGELDAGAVVARVGGHDVPLVQRWPVRRPRPSAERLDDAVPLHTGQRVVDLLFPIARGGSAGVPGGFGTGKTLLLQQIAKWCDADMIVYVGCGERGNEMADTLAELAELSDPRTGGRLLDRTVIIANTSNMPMMAREASIYTGITVAEFYRDMGYDTVVIADSTSRWAEALREFASRSGALPAEEGYPAELSSALAAFYERAGRVRTLGGSSASVTIVGAVSPPGGDLTEPVTTATERFVRAVWSLDRDLAYSRHYPAVSWSGSFSADVAALGAWHAARGRPDWAARRARAVAVLAEADRLASLAEILGAQSLPGRERMILLGGRLLREGVLMQNALSPHDAHCTDAKGAALLAGVLDVLDVANALVDDGVPASAVEECDLTPLLRARDDTAADDAAGVGAATAAVIDRLTRLRVEVTR
jgi:V/A-type H+-transporting ATPase subunit A